MIHYDRNTDYVHHYNTGAKKLLMLRILARPQLPWIERPNLFGAVSSSIWCEILVQLHVYLIGIVGKTRFLGNVRIWPLTSFIVWMSSQLARMTGYHWCYLRNLLWLCHYVAAMSQWHEYDHIMGVLLLYALRSLVRFPIRLESNQKASNLESTVPGNQKNNVWKQCCNYLQTDLSGSKANPNFKSTLNNNSLEETLTTLQTNQKRTWWDL